MRTLRRLPASDPPNQRPPLMLTAVLVLSAGLAWRAQSDPELATQILLALCGCMAMDRTSGGLHH